jgi:teichuronic acid exporter
VPVRPTWGQLMDIGDRIRSGARWLGATKVIAQTYTWILTVITMRLLSPDVYGLLAIATIFVSFLALFEELGIRVKLVQMKEYTLEYVRSVYGLSIVVNLTLALALIVFSPLIAAFFNREELALVVAVLAMQFILSSFAVIPDVMLKRELNFSRLALIDLAQGMTGATVTLVLAWLGEGVWALVFGTIAATLVRTVGLLVASPFKSLPSFKFRGLGETLQFGGIVTAQRLVWWTYSNVDRVLIGRFFDTHSLGIYSAGSQLATMPLDKIGNMLNVLSFTGLARAKDDEAQFRHFLVRAATLVSVTLFPIFFGIAVVANELVPLVFGNRWAGMEEVAAIIALSVPARCLSTPLVESLNSLGKPLESLKCTIVTGLLFVLAASIGVAFGIEGVAIGIVAASLLSFANNLRVLGRVAGLAARSILNAISLPLGASMIMGISLALIRPLLPFEFPSVQGLLVSIVFGAGIYSAILFAFDRAAFNLALSFLPVTIPRVRER